MCFRKSETHFGLINTLPRVLKKRMPEMRFGFFETYFGQRFGRTKRQASGYKASSFKVGSVRLASFLHVFFCMNFLIDSRMMMIVLRCHPHLVPWFLGSMVQHQQQGVRLHQFQCHNFHKHHLLYCHHVEACRHVLFVVEGGEISRYIHNLLLLS